MQTDSQPATTGSKAMFWTGWVITVLVAAVMTMSGAMKFKLPEDAAKNRPHIGWTEEQVFNLAIVEIACAAIYVFPPTSVLGAIMLTGYLGGAVATHVRVDDSFVPPVIIGVLVWVGIFLRDARMRALVPWRR